MITGIEEQFLMMNTKQIYTFPFGSYFVARD